MLNILIGKQRSLCGSAQVRMDSLRVARLKRVECYKRAEGVSWLSKLGIHESQRKTTASCIHAQCSERA